MIKRPAAERVRLVVLLDDGGALRHAGSAQDLEVNRSSD